MKKLSLLLILLSTLGLHSQTNFTLSFITLNNIDHSPLYLREGKELKELPLRNMRKSNPMKVKGLKTLQIFTDHPEPTKEQPYLLLGEAKLVPDTSKMLYFIRQQEKNKLQLFGIDDSTSAFPKSSYRFINFINAPIVVELDRQKIALKPRTDKVKKLTLTKDGEFTPFLIYNKAGEVLGGTRLFSHANNREMVLIFPPKKGKKRLDLRFFSD